MAATVGDFIYVFYRDDCSRYDPNRNSWSTMASSTRDLTWGVCGVVNNIAYLLGGYDWENSAGSNVIRTYNPSTNTWNDNYGRTPYASWGATRDNPVINGRIYYGFGQQPLATFWRAMYEYEPVGNTWSAALTQATYARDGVGCAVVGNALYVVGGRNVEPNPYGLDYNERMTQSSTR